MGFWEAPSLQLLYHSFPSWSLERPGASFIERPPYGILTTVKCVVMKFKTDVSTVVLASVRLMFQMVLMFYLILFGFCFISFFYFIFYFFFCAEFETGLNMELVQG